MESPFQQCIRLASVLVADGLFPKCERWRDVARCLRDVGCGGPDVDEMKSLQPFYAQYQCVVRRVSQVGVSLLTVVCASMGEETPRKMGRGKGFGVRRQGYPMGWAL